MRVWLRGKLPSSALTGFLSLALSACIALSQDITPPPEIVGTPSQPVSTGVPQEASATPTTSLEESVSEARVGAVSVEVIDPADGNLLKSGLDISLEGYDQFEQVFLTTRDLPPSGMITFHDVPFQFGRVFFASVEYGGAVYRSDFLPINDESPSLDLQVRIFDTTSDTTGLIIDQLRLIIDFPSPDIIQISEIYFLSNLGTAAVAPEFPGQISVEFPLPEGAHSLVFEEGALGQRYLQTEAGFGDTVPIIPGLNAYQVVVSYLLPYPKGGLDFSQGMNYPLSTVLLFLAPGEANLKSSTFEDQGIQSISNNQIQVYSGGPISEGGSLDFRVVGSPFGIWGRLSRFGGLPGWLIISLGVLGVGLLVSGIWLYFHRVQTADQDHQKLDRDRILDSIVALEDLYQAGEIDERSFQQKRDQLKDELRKSIKNGK